MIRLDIFDYAGNLVCPLYDSSSSASGQAHDIIATTQRNGWKELSFVIPGKMEVESGPQQPNFRLDYLKADYKLRLYATDDQDQGLLESHLDTTTNELVRDKEDWYLISQPTLSHENFTVNIAVKANHISQLLKTKNLGLSFSDKEGNNVGTARILLEYVLDGSGWSAGYVADFKEKDGSIKYRTLIAGERTGAFALITKIADLFEAKAIFHGQNNTVDLVPMNPFSEPVGGGAPDTEKADGTFELHYGKNIKNVSKSQSTDNIVTRLYAYGSYGDITSGYCGIDEITHNEWIYVCSAHTGEEKSFEIEDATGHPVTKYFTAATEINGTVIYSDFDPASRMYIWDVNNAHAHLVYDEPKTTDPPMINLSEKKEETNMFSSLMDFSYYREVGLFTDSALQAVATYQRTAPSALNDISIASAAMSEELNDLSQIVGSVDYVKLQSPVFTNSDGGTRIDFTGLVYTTQTDEKERDYFKWRAATSLKPDGSARNSGASVVYIVRDNADPLTFEKYYIKEGTREDGYIVLWDTWRNGYFDGSRVYVVSSDSVHGYLSAAEDAVASVVESLNESNKDVTIIHPTYFSETAPPLDEIQMPDHLVFGERTTDIPPYGWWWKTTKNEQHVPCRELYFSMNGEAWTLVNYGQTTPSVIIGSYFYNWRDKILRFGTSAGWHEFKEGQELNISQKFDRVISAALRRESYYEGYYQTYTYEPEHSLYAGNFAMDSGYGIYWLFTTDRIITPGGQLVYDTTDKQITQKTPSMTDSTLEVDHYTFDALMYHPANAALNVEVVSGMRLDTSDGTEEDAAGWYITKNIRIYPKISYVSNMLNCAVCFYNEKNRFMSSSTTDSTGHFVSPENVRYVRFSSNMYLGQLDVHADNYENLVIAENETYQIIPNASLVTSGVKKGLITQLKAFADKSDDVYGYWIKEIEHRQDDSKQIQNNMTNALGPMYREGWWQKESYVDGDEQKLYDDATETLQHISHPEETYNIGFVDYRGAVLDSSNGILPEPQHITIRSAAHLIDDDTGISKWAFIDTLKTCYDQPWKTQLQINTNLTTMSQHTFADVMAHIADIANNMSGRETMYARAAVIGRYNKILAENIEGQFNLDKIKLSDASSNVYQDDRGNWIFETPDGTSAMKLTGAGFCLASSRDKDGNWNWRTFGTGEGFTADMITSGHIKANLIEAGTITTEMIAAPVGSELNLVGNQSIRIVADSAIYDTDYSNGVNLLRGSTTADQRGQTTFLLNNIDLTDMELASETLTFRAFLKPDSHKARVMLRVYAESAFNDFYGNEIEAPSEGWSTITTILPAQVQRVGAYITADQTTFVTYNSAKVEFGEIPTEFSKCPDDIEDNVRNLERAVLDVNPRYITSSVSLVERFNEGNLYAESYDSPSADPSSIACAKNIQHGFTVEDVPTSGVTITVLLSQLSVANDYTVSFAVMSSTDASISCHLSDANQTVAAYVTANVETKVVAPFSSVTGPLTITITPAATCESCEIRRLMVQKGLVASEWVASNIPDPLLGANILKNGGFAIYGTAGVIDQSQFWTPTNATAIVVNSSVNVGDSSLTEYVDPTCNILVVKANAAGSYALDHVGVQMADGMSDGEYFTFSCRAASLNNTNNNTNCFLHIYDSHGNDIITPITINKTPSSRIEDYQYIEVTFRATDSTIHIAFEATAQSDTSRFFLYHCKLEKGVNATLYSEPILSTIYESYNQTVGDVASINQRVTSAELKLEPNAITSTVINNSQFSNKMDKLQSTTIAQTERNLRVEIATARYLEPSTAWFHFDTNDQQEPVLKLGNNITQFSTELSNTRLSFRQNTEEVAYISNAKLYITDAEFKHGFKLGKLNAITDQDGSINWSWDTSN